MNALVPALTSVVRHNAPAIELNVTLRMEKIWRRCAETELSGDYFPITECNGSPDDWYVCQFDDEKAGKGVIIAVRNTRAKDESFMFVPPCIREKKTYSFEIAGESVTDILANGRPVGEKSRISSSSLRKGMKIVIPKRSGAVIFYRYS